MSLSHSLLIVDDEKNTCDGLSRYLRGLGYEVFSALSSEEALDLYEQHNPELVLSDLRLGDGVDGLGLLDRIKEKNPQQLVILMTAYGTVENAVEAMKKGAYHYLMKPVNLDELSLVLEKAFSHKSLEQENKELKKKIKETIHPDLIVGKSPSFQSVYQEALQVAASTASVLIEGESGTGKELLARLIYEKSDRFDKPFVPVHCAALTQSLLESELFGHEKGAFTGAAERKIGRFERADKGTIFLDEIGEINLETQVKLLRVLQEGEFERVGGTKPIKVDIRLIAATNKNLLEEIQKGNFREDLYYRINVISLNVPALTERKPDIAEIFDYYLKRFAVLNNKKVKRVEPKVYAALQNYQWPGNIRELRNIAERMIVLMKDDEITLDMIPHDIRFSVPKSEPLISQSQTIPKLEDVERDMIRRSLVLNNGNKSKAAEALGISRRTLYRKLEEYDIS